MLFEIKSTVYIVADNEAEAEKYLVDLLDKASEVDAYDNQEAEWYMG